MRCSFSTTCDIPYAELLLSTFSRNFSPEFVFIATINANYNPSLLHSSSFFFKRIYLCEVRKRFFLLSSFLIIPLRDVPLKCGNLAREVCSMARICKRNCYANIGCLRFKASLLHPSCDEQSRLLQLNSHEFLIKYSDIQRMHHR